MTLRRSLLALSAAACGLAFAAAASAQTPAPTMPTAQPPASATAATPATDAATPAAMPSAFTPITPGADVVSTLKSSGQFTMFLKGLDATGLTAVLARPNLTVFAPTDAAFASVAGFDDMLKPGAGAAQLQKVLAYHIVATPITAAAAKGKIQNVDTAAQSKLYIDGFSDPMKVNDATVLQADVPAGGSHIYVIDKVVMTGFTPPPPPPEAAAPEAPKPPAKPAPRRR